MRDDVAYLVWVHRAKKRACFDIYGDRYAVSFSVIDNIRCLQKKNVSYGYNETRGTIKCYAPRTLTTKDIKEAKRYAKELRERLFGPDRNSPAVFGVHLDTGSTAGAEHTGYPTGGHTAP